MIIKDGKGTGNTLAITTENRNKTDSVTRSLTQHINETYEKHFSISFELIDPTADDDFIFYFKNTGTKNIHMTKFRFMCTGAPGAVELHHVSGTAGGGGATVVPVNRTLGSERNN